MVVSPAGLLSLPLKRLQTLLSISSNFQTWTGAANAAAALAFIHLVAVAGQSRPHALIGRSPGSGGARGSRTIQGGSIFEHGGRLLLRFENDIASGDLALPADAEFTFTNSVGAILADLEAASGEVGDLQVTSWSETQSPQRSSRDEKQASGGGSAGGEYYQATYAIEWSGEF